jgi:hypothetical protein
LPCAPGTKVIPGELENGSLGIKIQKFQKKSKNSKKVKKNSKILKTKLVLKTVNK